MNNFPFIIVTITFDGRPTWTDFKSTWISYSTISNSFLIFVIYPNGSVVSSLALDGNPNYTWTSSINNPSQSMHIRNDGSASFTRADNTISTAYQRPALHIKTSDILTWL